MKTLPSLLPFGTRRRLPWKDGSRNLIVPLWPTERRGEMVEGRLTVSATAALAEPHTNAFLHMQDEQNRKIVEWIDWRAKKGWVLAGEVAVSGPFDLPTPDAQTPADPEQRYFRVRARFTRETPVYVPFHDFLEIKRQADLYRVDVNRPLPTTYVLPKNESGPNPVTTDPMQWGVERREALGLQADDPMFEKVDRDWATPDAADG